MGYIGRYIFFRSGGRVLRGDTFQKTSCGLRTVCYGPETPTEWKSESVLVSDGRTDSPV